MQNKTLGLINEDFFNRGRERLFFENMRRFYYITHYVKPTGYMLEFRTNPTWQSRDSIASVSGLCETTFDCIQQVGKFFHLGYDTPIQSIDQIAQAKEFWIKEFNVSILDEVQHGRYHVKISMNDEKTGSEDHGGFFHVDIYEQSLIELYRLITKHLRWRN